MNESNIVLQRNLPLVSILMTTFNCKDNLLKTLENIMEQDYPSIQIIIVDGGSSDGTVDIIKSYDERISYQETESYSGYPHNQRHLTMKWISEPDHGIYDGMNKAFHLSDGEVIAICNDRYTRSDAISLFVRKLLEIERIRSYRDDLDEDDIYLTGVHSDLIYVDGDECKRLWKMGQGNIHFGWMPAHPTLFLRRQVYEKYGLYDNSYKISADYDFMLRILKEKKVELGYIPEILINMYFGGTSNGGGGLGYLHSVWEAYLVLLHNKIMFPFTALLCRIIRTFGQYHEAKLYNAKN